MGSEGFRLVGNDMRRTFLGKRSFPRSSRSWKFSASKKSFPGALSKPINSLSVNTACIGLFGALGC